MPIIPENGNQTERGSNQQGILKAHDLSHATEQYTADRSEAHERHTVKSNNPASHILSNQGLQ